MSAARKRTPEPAEVRITVRVPLNLAKEFERIAVAEDRTVSGELRRLMRSHVQERQELKS